MKQKFLFLSLIAATALVSCNEADAPQMPVEDAGNELTFSPYLMRNTQSRGTVTTTSSIRDFGVFATWCQGLDYASGDKSFNFMNNQMVKFYGSNDWRYNPRKYWPEGSEKVSFFAYSPYVATGTPRGADDETWVDPHAEILNGAPTLTYNMGLDISGQFDLLYTSVVDRTNRPVQVNLEFNHALSRLAFSIDPWQNDFKEAPTSVTINAVKLVTNFQRAKLNLMTGEWSDVEFDDDYRAITLSTRKGNIRNNVITSGMSESGLLMPENEYFMVMPSVDEDGLYYLLVDYTITTIDESLPEGRVESRHLVYSNLEVQFEPGKAYLIKMGLNVSGATAGDPGPSPVDPDPDPDYPMDAVPTGYTGMVSFRVNVTEWQDWVEPAGPR